MSALEPCPRIAELEAEVERLRAALQSIADLYLTEGDAVWEAADMNSIALVALTPKEPKE